MRFISIPNQGSSWSAPLLYSFDTELETAADVDIDIWDCSKNSIIAKKRLYGVISSQIDIAPILRSIYDMRIDDSVAGIAQSPATIMVCLDIMGLKSEPRLFSVTTLDVAKPKLLCSMPMQQSVSYGEKILFSLYVPTKLKVQIRTYTNFTSRALTLESDASGISHDIVVATLNFPFNTTRIEITISDGSTTVTTLTYHIEPGVATARRLFWRNWQGGIESYLFPQSIRLMQEAVVDSLTCGEQLFSVLRTAQQRYRLCSAFEDSTELRRISEMLLSPYIYEMTAQGLRTLKLETRSVEYDKHGELRRIALEVYSDWKGGES